MTCATIRRMATLGSTVPFVARTDELNQLRAALGRATSGSPVAVLIAGDAGVGKTRLMSELVDRARAEGAYVLIGRCLTVGESGLPYLPFIDIVEAARAAEAEIVASRPPLQVLTGHAGRAATTTGPHDLGQLQLFDAVLSALTDLAARQPVLVVLEDLHWSDASTRDLLLFLLSRLSSQRLLVVCTHRSDDLHRRHPLRPLLAELTRLPIVERLDLQPFGLDDSRAFVTAATDGSLGPSETEEIASRSEGNAFFAEELIATSSDGAGALPTALADVLLARFEQLSLPTQRVVSAISVTGRWFVRHSTLSRVLDLDQASLDAALREAVEHHILTTHESGYGFRHALLREAVYSDLLPGERVRLHAAYARLITEDGDENRAAMLAYHSINSNNLEQALAASIQAAANAMKVGALRDELHHVEKALELWHAVDSPEQVSGTNELDLLLKGQYVASAAGYPERALAFGRAALSLADQSDDTIRRADVRRKLTNTMLSNGLWTEAEDTIAEAWALVKESPPSRERAWVLAMYARATEDSDQVQKFAEAAVNDAHVSDAAEPEADALISLAFVALANTGDAEQAWTLLEKAEGRAIAAKAPDVELRARFNHTVTHYEIGDLDVAARNADESVQRAHELGLAWSPYGLELHWLRAMVHYHRGSWDDALEAASHPGERVSDTVTALLAASRAMVKVGRGKFDDAERLLRELRPEWQRDSQISQLAGIAGAELVCWQGKPEMAATIVDEALDSMRKRLGEDWPLGGIRLATLGLSAAADLAVVARLQHDASAESRSIQGGERYAEHANQTAENGVPRGAELGPEGLAWRARTRAEVSRLHGEHRPDLWRDVVTAFGHGEAYHIALARWRLAEALIATDDRSAAETELKQALATADGLQARPLAQAVRELAARARITLPGGIAPASTDLLTPREHAVLELVAEGLTNREVGERLFISEKTVSVHTSRVMSKLGASSRTEAVTLAYQRGLISPPV